jgi:hypothetical protein
MQCFGATRKSSDREIVCSAESQAFAHALVAAGDVAALETDEVKNFVKEEGLAPFVASFWKPLDSASYAALEWLIIHPDLNWDLSEALFMNIALNRFYEPGMREKFVDVLKANFSTPIVWDMGGNACSKIIELIYSHWGSALMASGIPYDKIVATRRIGLAYAIGDEDAAPGENAEPDVVEKITRLRDEFTETSAIFHLFRLLIRAFGNTSPNRFHDLGVNDVVLGVWFGDTATALSALDSYYGVDGEQGMFTLFLIETFDSATRGQNMDFISAVYSKYGGEKQFALLFARRIIENLLNINRDSKPLERFLDRVTRHEDITEALIFEAIDYATVNDNVDVIGAIYARRDLNSFDWRQIAMNALKEESSEVLTYLMAHLIIMEDVLIDLMIHAMSMDSFDQLSVLLSIPCFVSTMKGVESREPCTLKLKMTKEEHRLMLLLIEEEAGEAAFNENRPTRKSIFLAPPPSLYEDGNF